MKQKTITLPCEIGDVFYGIHYDYYYEYIVKAFIIDKKGIWFETSHEIRFLYGSNGFLTEEEAEAKIKEETK